KGNIDKNLKKHGVTNDEAEQVFSNAPLISLDIVHSTHFEKRYQCLGVTDKNKKLFISFTIRKDNVRIISVRLISRKERKLYD
ncbi:hypothetical protein A2382_03230, partial [Candidatus Woesebacteria bacterium RIFOXYB1_FULL_38_16]